MNIELDRDHILGGLAEIWTEWSDWAEGLGGGRAGSVGPWRYAGVLAELVLGPRAHRVELEMALRGGERSPILEATELGLGAMVLLAVSVLPLLGWVLWATLHLP